MTPVVARSRESSRLAQVAQQGRILPAPAEAWLGFKKQRASGEGPPISRGAGVWAGVWRRELLLLSPAREAGCRVWASSRKSRTHDKGSGTGFPGGLPRPKLFLLGGGWAGGGRKRGRERWGQPFPLPRQQLLWNANPDSAW